MQQSIDPTVMLVTELQNFEEVTGVIESVLREMNFFINEAVQILGSESDFKLDKLQNQAQSMGNIFVLYAERDRLDEKIRQLGQESIDGQFTITQFKASQSFQNKNKKIAELRVSFTKQCRVLAGFLEKKYKNRLQEFTSRNLNRSQIKVHLKQLIKFKTAHEYLMEFIKIVPSSIIELNPKYITRLAANCKTLKRETEELELRVAHESSDTSSSSSSAASVSSTVSSTSSSSSSSSSGASHTSMSSDSLDLEAEKLDGESDPDFQSMVSNSFSSSSSSSGPSYASTSCNLSDSIESDLALQQAVQNSLRENPYYYGASSSSSFSSGSSYSSTSADLFDSKRENQNLSDPYLLQAIENSLSEDKLLSGSGFSSSNSSWSLSLPPNLKIKPGDKISILKGFSADSIPKDPVALLAAFISSGMAKMLQNFIAGKAKLVAMEIPIPSSSSWPAEDKENKIFGHGAGFTSFSSSSSSSLFSTSASSASFPGEPKRRRMLAQVEEVRKVISQLAGPTNEENAPEEVSSLIKGRNQLTLILGALQNEPPYLQQESDMNMLLGRIETINAKLKPFEQIFPETVAACLASLENSATSSPSSSLTFSH